MPKSLPGWACQRHGPLYGPDVAGSPSRAKIPAPVALRGYGLLTTPWVYKSVISKEGAPAGAPSSDYTCDHSDDDRPQNQPAPHWANTTSQPPVPEEVIAQPAAATATSRDAATQRGTRTTDGPVVRVFISIIVGVVTVNENAPTAVGVTLWITSVVVAAATEVPVAA